MKLGTGMSILISKRNPSLVITFGLLSCGYVLNSYKEDGNVNENVFSFPWAKDGPVVLGSRFKDAFQEPSVFLSLEPFFEKERYAVTYNPAKGKVYTLLKDKAKSDDILKAAFHAQVLLHFMGLSDNRQHVSQQQLKHGYSNSMPTEKELEAYIVESCKTVSHSYGAF